MFYFIVITILSLLGMYLSLGYMKRAEKEEVGQGEYSLYLFTGILWLAVSCLGGIVLSEFGLWPGKIFTVLAIFILAALIFVLWTIFGSGKTKKTLVFMLVLLVVNVSLAAKLFL